MNILKALQQHLTEQAPQLTTWKTNHHTKQTTPKENHWLQYHTPNKVINIDQNHKTHHNLHLTIIEQKNKNNTPITIHDTTYDLTNPNSINTITNTIKNYLKNNPHTNTPTHK